MMESFAGVHVYNFLVSGVRENPDEHGEFYPEKVYRHFNFVEKIQTARLIKLQVFGWDKTSVVSELIFSGTGDLESWFAMENVVGSSLWDLSSFTPGEYGKVFRLGASNLLSCRQFFINNGFGGCNNDNGWFAIVTRDSHFLTENLQ